MGTQAGSRECVFEVRTCSSGMSAFKSQLKSILNGSGSFSPLYLVLLGLWSFQMMRIASRMDNMVAGILAALSLGGSGWLLKSWFFRRTSNAAQVDTAKRSQ